MERLVYQQMAELDERHWWYLGRRAVLAALISRTVKLPKRARILEIGCGTGHNFAMLSQFGKIDALELDDEVRAIAEKRLGKAVMTASLPDLAGVPDRTYDMIAAFDVIEHIDDDQAALASIAAKLKLGGKLVMTVPAHQWMWSSHDVMNQHRRRYSKAALRRLIDHSPLQVEKLGYFNSLLFPLAVAQRVIMKLRGADDDAGFGIPPAPINAAMERVFTAERHLVGKIFLPPGLSLFAVASAKQG